MPNCVPELVALLTGTALEAVAHDPSLVLPEDATSFWRGAAVSLQGGTLQTVAFLRKLPERSHDCVIISTLQLLCERLKDQEASVRQRMLDRDVMSYIVWLLDDGGARAPCVRTMGVRLLSCLILRQPSAALSSFMTRECIEKLTRYLNAGHTILWVLPALEVVMTASNDRALLEYLLHADIAGALNKLLEYDTAEAEPDLPVYCIGALWHVHGACNAGDDLRELDLLRKLVDDLEALTVWTPTHDMLLALILRCIKNVPHRHAAGLLNKTVGICAGILTLAPLTSNVVRQILALVLIARISRAPTSSRCNAYLFAYSAITPFFNEHCQVRDSEQLQTVFTIYAELAQTMVPKTRQQEFLLHKVLLHLLNTIARSQMFTESAKGQLLQALQKPYEAGTAPRSPISDNHEKFFIELLVCPGTDTKLIEAGLSVVMQHIIPDSERLGVHGAGILMSFLLNFNQKHLQDSGICIGIVGCLQMLMNGPYAQGDGLPDDLRMQLIDKLAMANFFLLRQLGTGIATNDLLGRVVNSADDIDLMLKRNGNGGFLAKKFKCSTLLTNRAEREADAAFIYFLLLMLVDICKTGGFRPPQLMVTAVEALKAQRIDQVGDVLENSPVPQLNSKIFLWEAVVFVCWHTKVQEAKHVVAKMKEPTEEKQSFRSCKQRLQELFRCIDVEAEESRRKQQALIDEVEQGGPPQMKKKRSKKKKGQAPSEAGAAGVAPVVAAEESEVVPAPAPASMEEGEQEGPPEKKENKKTREAAARGKEPAAAVAGAAGAPEFGHECVVCFKLIQESMLCAFVPCGHANVCEECSLEQAESCATCPTCRTPITQTLRLFF